MPVQTSVFRTRDRIEEPIEIEIHRYNLAFRLARSIPIFVGSVILGAVSILIPAVHLISTWFIPLLGTGVAFYVFRIEAKIGRVVGNCPSCRSPVDEQGGPYEEPMWIRCSSCNIPLEIIIPAPAESA